VFAGSRVDTLNVLMDAEIKLPDRDERPYLLLTLIWLSSDMRGNLGVFKFP
jgi:hypothetical protein